MISGRSIAARALLAASLAVLAACDLGSKTLVFREDHPEVDPVRIDRLLEAIGDRQYGEMHSVVLIVDGELVLETYFNGYTWTDKQPLYSVTKSFLSALIGIAIADGHIASIDQAVLPYFPEYPNLPHVDSRKHSLTLKHLITMTAGLQWNELAVPYDDPRNDYQRYLASADRIEYVLGLPMAHHPGTRVGYNTALSQVLSVILTKATGQSAADYAREQLFSPLGIDDWSWSSYTADYSVGGAGLYLRAIDIAKLGQLYLQDGVWEGQRVVPAHWVRSSTAPFAGAGEWQDYGYHWWRYNRSAADRALSGHEDIYYALGRGGQYVWVLPWANAVASCTAWNDNNGYWPEPMLWEYIIPALRR